MSAPVWHLQPMRVCAHNKVVLAICPGSHDFEAANISNGSAAVAFV